VPPQLDVLCKRTPRSSGTDKRLGRPLTETHPARATHDSPPQLPGPFTRRARIPFAATRDLLCDGSLATLPARSYYARIIPRQPQRVNRSASEQSSRYLAHALDHLIRLGHAKGLIYEDHHGTP
jgi:hypothetical protein